MPRLRTPDRSLKRWKPPIGAEVDWGHPLARGLVAYWPFFEGAGSTVRDICPTPLHGNVTTARPWQGGPLGPDLNLANASGYVDLSSVDSYTSKLAQNGSFSLLICFRTTLSATRYIIGRTNNANIINYEIYYTTSGTHRFRARISDAVATVYADYAIVNDGIPLQLVAIRDVPADTLRLCGNGVSGTPVSDTTTGNIAFASGTIRTNIGSSGSSTGNTMDGNFIFAGLYNRALSNAEAAWLYSSPFCFLRVPRRRTYGFVSGGAALKTVTDTGQGADAIGQILASLSVSDSGSGADAMGSLGAALVVPDAGHGSDALAQLLAALIVSDTGGGADALAALAASLGVSDAGHGADAISQLLASLSVADTGHGIDSVTAYLLKLVTDSGVGTDAVGSLSVSLSIADTGGGTDAIGSLAVYLSPSDTGHGTDVVFVDTGATIKTVSDAGYGTDAIGAILAALSVADAGIGTDSVTGGVRITVSDVGSGVDLVAQVLRRIIATDTGHGTDSVGQVTVSVSVAESGHGADIVGAIAVLLAVAELAHGTDAVLKWDSTAQIASMTFSLKKRQITIGNFKQPSISIGSFKNRQITFTLN